MFNELKNRDAWSTIRGYVYQVNLTILRWLSLREDEVLELEKGEDIDIVNQGLEKESLRELEQIKYRESTISLNQAETLEILLNFYLHKVNNPTTKILFRFVTNADYNIERPAIFDDGKSGIAVWRELHEIDVIQYDDGRLTGLQRHLREKIEKIIVEKKSKSKEETDEQRQWTAFKSYIEDANKFIDFVKGFEWSMRNYDHAEIRTAVENKLSEKTVAKENIETVYARLFLFVFRLLTSNTLKRLSNEDVSNQLALDTLSETDEKFAHFLQSILSNIDLRLQQLETVTEKNAAQIADVVSTLTSIQKYDSVFDYRLHNLSINAPALIKNGTKREKKVAELIALFTKVKWIALQGINGTGKTQLAVAVYEKFGNKFWLDLKPFAGDEEKCVLVIESFLFTITNCPILHARDIWIKEVVNTLPVGSIIVINDVPNTNNDSQVAFLLINLAEALSTTNGKLLTTSNHKVSSEIKNQFDDQGIIEYDKLELSEEEVKEILSNNNAPKTVYEYLSIIGVVSGYNPRLVNAIVHKLKQINWGQDEGELLDNLFKNELTEEILQDAQASIKKHITDKYSRELLYRLSLIYWEFNFKEITAISNVPETIPHPNEKFQDLVNIWIQKNEGSFSISPIISNIGEKNLAHDVIQYIHIKIAATILSDTPLNQVTASRCILSFIKGNDLESAGTVLLSIYSSTQTNEHANNLQKWGYLSYWKGTDIPKDMNVIKRAFIRCEQIRLTTTIGKDATIFQKSLESYTQETFKDRLEELMVRLLYLPYSPVSNLNIFIANFQSVLDNLESAGDELKALINPELIRDLLWLPIQKIVTLDEIELWLILVSTANEKLNLEIFNADIARSAISVLADRIANSENYKPAAARDMTSIKNRLELLIKYFEDRDIENMAAIVARNMVTIQYRLKDHQTDAEKLTLEYIGKYSSNEARYFIYENYGKLLYNDKRIVESQIWLEAATNFPPIPNINFLDTLIYFAAATSEIKPLEAVQSCERALELAENQLYASEFDYIQVMGELAIAYWLNAENENSFLIFERVIVSLLELKANKYGKEWIRIFSLVGHSLGYISASVAKEKTPKFVSDGSEYLKPYQGILLFSTRDLSDLFKPENMPLVLAQLAVFADGINNISKAYQWSLKAFDLARKNGNERVLQIVSIACSQYSLINFKLEETFETFLLHTVVANYLPGNPQEKYDALGKTKLSDIVKSKPSKEWDDAESTTLLFAIIPLFILVLDAQLEDASDKATKQNEFLQMLKDYISKASDKELWKSVFSLCKKILLKTISEGELTVDSNNFGGSDQKNLQIICLLGVIYLTKTADVIAKQIINIFPYLTKVHSTNSSVIKFVFIPFVKNRSIYAFNESYMGQKQEHDEILANIHRVDISNKNALQLILQPIIGELDINGQIGDDRKQWLYEYKEI